MAFKRRTGKSEFRVYNSAGTIAAGDSVQFDENGEVVVGAAGAEILGVAVNAATSSTTCTVDIAHPGDVFEVDVSTGTMGTTETIGDLADLEDENSITLSTNTNNDVLIVDWDGTSTDKAYVTFKNLAYGA